MRFFSLQFSFGFNFEIAIWKANLFIIKIKNTFEKRVDVNTAKQIALSSLSTLEEKNAACC
jgi:hypothetical protein